MRHGHSRRPHASIRMLKPRKLKPDVRPQVLLALEWYVPEFHCGVAQYAQEHNWTLHDSLAYNRQKPPEKLHYDGIITLLTQTTQSMTRRLITGAKVPVVDLNDDCPGIQLPRVLADNEMIGRLAAEHLISRGFRHLVYYQTSDSAGALDRRAGFRRAVKAAGREFILLSAVRAFLDKDSLQHRLAWLARKLVKLPRPFGIMGQFDVTANELCMACGRAGLPVPEEVAIVGVDNISTCAEFGEIPLTSVDSNLHGRGYQGAALLDRLMRGEKAPAEPIRVPPKGLVARRSTDILMIENPVVAAALRHINAHFRENLQAESIARAAGVSLRSLYRLFQEHLGRSVAEEIERLRLTCARQMIAGTDLKISAIARDAGFVSSESMTAAFLKHYGKRPSECR